MERIDSFSKCKIDGCNNLGEVLGVINHKVYRRKFCTKHKRLKYGLPKQYNRNNEKSKDRFKKRGLDKKCMICGWDGPCDIHRKEPQGSYNMKNMIATCPNCHRLLSRDIIQLPKSLVHTDFSVYKLESGISPFM